MSTRDQGALDAPIAVRPDRRGLARGRDLLSPFLRDYLTRPRDYIVPQQINARVASGAFWDTLLVAASGGTTHPC